MNIELFSFPTINDNRFEIEHVYCELLNRYRSGETLDPEALDWLDSANTWLSTSDEQYR